MTLDVNLDQGTCNQGSVHWGNGRSRAQWNFQTVLGVIQIFNLRIDVNGLHRNEKLMQMRNWPQQESPRA